MTADAIAVAAPKPVPTWAVITVLSLAGTTVSLQQTMVIPLLPAFQQLLQVSADDISWLVTATLLTAAVAAPIVARLADMYGRASSSTGSAGSRSSGYPPASESP